jgi:hypothetical protein
MTAEATRVPPDVVTRPDQIDPPALSELGLLHEERVLRCWKSAFGFLVMTNLRCIHVWRKPELFVRTEWHTGPTFFFYNLRRPELVLGRFVQLAEIYDEGAGPARFLVRDAPDVCREIDAARVEGQREWAERRTRARADMGRLGPAPVPPGTTVVIREIVKVRCAYCGNLMEESRTICPSCGAPQR